MIDWNGKLEAVHTDGRVVPVYLGGNPDNPDGAGDYYTLPVLPGCVGNGIWKDSGNPWAGIDKGWTIRNVTTVLSPTPDERAVAPELVARLVELARSVAGTNTYAPYKVAPLFDEARAIVAALDPVDPDEAEVTKLLQMDDTTRNIVRLAIKRGRALASRDVTPCTREQFEEACRV